MKKIFVLLLFLPFVSHAQDAGAYAGEKAWYSEEIALMVGMLVFTVFVVVIEAILIVKSKQNWEPDLVIKIIGLTLIVCFSVILIAMQYDQDQTAPIMGLFGVIAGYLLGHEPKNNGAHRIRQAS